MIVLRGPFIPTPVNWKVLFLTDMLLILRQKARKCSYGTAVRHSWHVANL
jgi:hypothetical protein